MSRDLEEIYSLLHFSKLFLIFINNFKIFFMNIFDCSLEDLERYFVEINEKKYVASQLFNWIYKKIVFDFSKMTNLSNDLRSKLSRDFMVSFPVAKNVLKSKGTVKYLFELYDGNLIESVIMKHKYGLSICVSSQVGCNRGCAFCQSGKTKKIRNLSVSELVAQVIFIENDLNKKISSVVVMGIGEPFDNYDNVLKFVKIINDKNGLNIGARHITISTVGIPKFIEKYASENIQSNLAVSLHASNDVLRSRLMPINKVWNLKKLLSSVKKYIDKTKRRVCIQYIMINDVNDSKKCALELAELLSGLNVYVNLIVYNRTSDPKFSPSSENRVECFMNILKLKGIDACVRVKLGPDINASCGQLRANSEM